MRVCASSSSNSRVGVTYLHYYCSDLPGFLSHAHSGTTTRRNSISSILEQKLSDERVIYRDKIRFRNVCRPKFSAQARRSRSQDVTAPSLSKYMHPSTQTAATRLTLLSSHLPSRQRNPRKSRTNLDGNMSAPRWQKVIERALEQDSKSNGTHPSLHPIPSLFRNSPPFQSTN